MSLLERIVSSSQNGLALCLGHFVMYVDHKSRFTAVTLSRNKLNGLVSLDQDRILATIRSSHHFPTVN